MMDAVGEYRDKLVSADKAVKLAAKGYPSARSLFLGHH